MRTYISTLGEITSVFHAVILWANLFFFKINKPGTTQVVASLKVQKSSFSNMHSDKIVKNFIYSVPVIPEGISIRFENHVSLGP